MDIPSTMRPAGTLSQPQRASRLWLAVRMHCWIGCFSKLVVTARVLTFLLYSAVGQNSAYSPVWVFIHLTCGVPQGSILAMHLYAFFFFLFFWRFFFPRSLLSRIECILVHCEVSYGVWCFCLFPKRRVWPNWFSMIVDCPGFNRITKLVLQVSEQTLLLIGTTIVEDINSLIILPQKCI